MKEVAIELFKEIAFLNRFKSSIPGWVSRIIFYGSIYTIIRYLLT